MSTNPEPRLIDKQTPIHLNVNNECSGVFLSGVRKLVCKINKFSVKKFKNTFTLCCGYVFIDALKN